MITPINILLIIIWGLIIPFISGMLVSIMNKSEKNIYIAESISYGYAVMFAVFEVLSVPMIFAHIHFHVLKSSFIVAMLIICIVTIVLLFKRLQVKENDSVIGISIGINKYLKEIKSNKLTLIIWVMAIVVILFETWLLASKMHIDTDDARFLAEAMEAIEKDTMLLYHPITGVFYNVPAGEQLKDIVAPYPIYLGLLGALCGMHPTIFAHTILPVIYIPLCYGVCSMIARFFFDEDIRNTGLFLLFISLIHLFSFETIYSSGYTLLTIIWQGRSVVAMIMLPLLFVTLMRMTVKDSLLLMDYLIMLIVLLASAMLSNMGAVFSVVLAFTYSLVNLIKRKSIKIFAFMCICMIPNAVFAVAEKLLVHFALLYK